MQVLLTELSRIDNHSPPARTDTATQSDRDATDEGGAHGEDLSEAHTSAAYTENPEMNPRGRPGKVGASHDPRAGRELRTRGEMRPLEGTPQGARRIPNDATLGDRIAPDGGGEGSVDSRGNMTGAMGSMTLQEAAQCTTPVHHHADHPAARPQHTDDRIRGRPA